MMTSQILKSVNFTKVQNLDISRTKYFYSDKKHLLITHQGLLYGKNSFLVEVTFNFEHISHFILLLLLLNSIKQMAVGPEKL